MRGRIAATQKWEVWKYIGEDEYAIYRSDNDSTAVFCVSKGNMESLIEALLIAKHNMEQGGPAFFFNRPLSPEEALLVHNSEYKKTV